MITTELQSLNTHLAAEEGSLSRGLLHQFRERLRIFREQKRKELELLGKSHEIKSNLFHRRKLNHFSEWIRDMENFVGDLIHRQNHAATIERRNQEILEKITAGMEGMHFKLAQKNNGTGESSGLSNENAGQGAIQAQLESENALHGSNIEQMQSLNQVIKALGSKLRSQIDIQLAQLKKQGVMNKIIPYVSTVVMTLMAAGVPALVAATGLVLATVQKMAADLLMAAGTALFNTGKTLLHENSGKKIKLAASRMQRLEQNQIREWQRQELIKSQLQRQGQVEEKISGRVLRN